LDFKSELDIRDIKINSIMENTIDNFNTTNTLIFNLSINMYETSKFIIQNRINK